METGLIDFIGYIQYAEHVHEFDQGNVISERETVELHERWGTSGIGPLYMPTHFLSQYGKKQCNNLDERRREGKEWARLGEMFEYYNGSWDKRNVAIYSATLSIRTRR